MSVIKLSCPSCATVVQITDPQAAIRFSTSASPRRSASARSAAVTSSRTAAVALSVTGHPRPVEPRDGRSEREAASEQSADNVGLPVDGEVHAVENHC